MSMTNVVPFNGVEVVHARHFKEIVAVDFFDARVKLMKELQKTKIELQVLAETAQLSQQTVSRMKHGETFDPRGKTLVNLYRALGIRLVFE